MSPYWQEQMSPWTRASTNISEQLMRLPAMRAMGQQRAAMSNYYQAHAGQEDAAAEEAHARAGYSTAQTQDILKKGELVDKLQKSAPAAQRAMLAGNFEDPSIDDFTGATAALTGANKDDIQASMKKGLGTLLALRGNVGMAGAVENPASVANNQANNERLANAPRVLPANSTLVNPNSGSTISLGNALMHPGEQLFTPDQDTLTYGNGAAASGPPQPVKPSAVDVEGARLAAGLVKGGPTIDSGVSGTNAPIGMKIYDALLARNGSAPTGPTPTNAPASAGAAPAPNGSNLPAVPGTFGTNAAPMKYSTPDDVKADYRTGKLDRATASQILQSQFGMQ